MVELEAQRVVLLLNVALTELEPQCVALLQTVGVKERTGDAEAEEDRDWELEVEREYVTLGD